ncbi:hypothetical protein PIIN_06401 [Serendipita indica DSM 11827]|uniref:Uncharacterized protein n=1 Tax=Serendipita indica (strain DSM 11827) TaxID=1109443 RepID=G4TMC3_SERID|nr:hypothetical protein PIIN_06401 [Serendipita indica DSM 11827]
MPPPIQLFLTTIASEPKLRSRQEYLLRTLQVKKIPFVSYDLASDPNAKRLWRRRAPKDNQALPGMLLGGVWPGTFEQFETAVETGTLETFLRMNEDYNPEIDGKVLEAQPIGVPGAVMPEAMTGQKPSFAPNGPTPIRKSGPKGSADELVDAGDVLPGFGFQGMMVTIGELTELAKDLKLDDKEQASVLAKAAKASKQATSSSSKEPSKESDDTKPAPVDTDREHDATKEPGEKAAVKTDASQEATAPTPPAEPKAEAEVKESEAKETA